MSKNKKNENIEQEVTKIDVDSLSEEQAREVLKELIAENEKLNEEIKSLEEKINSISAEKENLSSMADQNKDNWYRTAAEFENFKRRNQETRKNAYIDGKKDCLTSLLVIGDSIDRAMALDMDEKTKEGVALISRQFYDTLSSIGVAVIDPIGEEFTPDTSEAIATVSCEEGEEQNLVKTVFKKGYSLDGKIIRYCQVVVTK